LEWIISAKGNLDGLYLLCMDKLRTETSPPPDAPKNQFPSLHQITSFHKKFLQTVGY